MNKMSIALPDPIRRYVERRVEEGRYRDASSFVLELIQKDRDERPMNSAELNDHLDEASASGIASRQVPEVMADVKARLKADGFL